MKKHLIMMLLLITTISFTQEHKFVKKAETENATILQKGEGKNWCSVCGMNLKMFYKTNHAAIFEDGTVKQYCSIRCLATEPHNHDNHIKKVLVVDAGTEKFTNAKNAYYVIGSKVPGTMTKVSKIAFAKKEDAEKFSKKYYGKKIVGFNEALQLAKEQLKTDNAMLMKKKEMKIYPKGKKLFNKVFDGKFELPEVKSIAELKAALKQNKKTKQLDEKKLQVLAVYLWDVKLNKHTHNATKTAIGNIPEDAKCPVCGMFVYKYPRWAAVLDVSIEGKQQKLYFDGVKDLMKFFYAPGKYGNYKNIKLLSIDVTDYYQQKKIAGENAYYVIGSDILGPMGNELIPFEKEEDAKVFSKDHFGKKILPFNEITEDVVNGLDEQ